MILFCFRLNRNDQCLKKWSQMAGERLAPNHCRICREELNELNYTIIKINQDHGPKNINSCGRLRGLGWFIYVKKGNLLREEFRKDFFKKDRITPGPTPVEITRLKLCSESTPFKKFDYCACCLVCCAHLWDQETDADGRFVTKPDRSRVNKISFVKSKIWFDNSIHR